MKLRTILNEVDLDAFRAQLAKAKGEVDAERSEKASSFKELAYAFGDSIKTFDTMLNILKDKAEKGPNKARDTDNDEVDSPISQAMKKHGLLTNRGGVTPLAYKYLRWVASENMNVPTADDFPNRYKQSTIDRVADAEKMGNFPPAVVSALRQFDNKKTTQGREDGQRMRPNLGAARSKLIGKINAMLPNIKNRIQDRSRPR